MEAAAAHLAGKHAEVDRLIALAHGRETVRIGEMAFELPAGISKARRRALLDAAEQHVLERGEITIADARRLLRERAERAVWAQPKRKRPRRRTKYARRERDTARMLWTKAQPCAVGCMLGVEYWRGPVAPGRCTGPVEAHHAGMRGVGQKAADDTVIPLCSGHHRALTNRSGAFAGWPSGAVKRWELAMVAVYQQRYAEYFAGGAEF